MSVSNSKTNYEKIACVFHSSSSEVHIDESASGKLDTTDVSMSDATAEQQEEKQPGGMFNTVWSLMNEWNQEVGLDMGSTPLFQNWLNTHVTSNFRKAIPIYFNA